MRIAVIGLGLIGGSLLRALGAAGHDVTGYDSDPHTRQLARAAEITHATIADTVRDAAVGADIVVLAVPLPAVSAVLTELGDHPGLITDVVSVKEPVAQLMTARRYVGGHPMAGTEHSGFAHADSTLFRNRPWALCLDADTNRDDWATVARLLGELGARVISITSHDHDAAVARVSHVPHLLASALAASAAAPETLALAAGSYGDGTRVAATAPALVAAMCSGNAPRVRETLDEVIADLLVARAVLDNPRELEEWLTRGYNARRNWSP